MTHVHEEEEHLAPWLKKYCIFEFDKKKTRMDNIKNRRKKGEKVATFLKR